MTFSILFLLFFGGALSPSPVTERAGMRCTLDKKTKPGAGTCELKVVVE